MADSATCLLDINILLRTGKIVELRYPEIERALDVLIDRGFRFCFTSQILGEFWNVCTRSFAHNGFGLTVEKADILARRIEAEHARLHETSAIHERWRALLVELQVNGVRVHDTRIAATMYAHGVSHPDA